jgi:hypothetical protein
MGMRLATSPHRPLWSAADGVGAGAVIVSKKAKLDRRQTSQRLQSRSTEHPFRPSGLRLSRRRLVSRTPPLPSAGAWPGPVHASRHEHRDARRGDGGQRTSGSGHGAEATLQVVVLLGREIPVLPAPHGSHRANEKGKPMAAGRTSPRAATGSAATPARRSISWPTRLVNFMSLGPGTQNCGVVLKHLMLT